MIFGEEYAVEFNDSGDNTGQFNHLIIGGNKSGKTTLQIEIATEYRKARPNKRVLWVLVDDGEKKLWNLKEIGLDIRELTTFEGTKKLIIDSAQDFEFIANTFKPFKNSKGERVCRQFNGLMCCDDLGGAMNRRPAEIIAFFKKRRQPNIDFLFSFHGLRADVPPAFYTYVNSIFLFRTSDQHEGILKNLPSHKRDEFEHVYHRVQKISETEPHYCEEIIINPLDI